MDDILAQLEKFHGHLGPYAVIGYKMGTIANKKLGKDPFKKKAEVWTGTKPPISCIIDGIQISSGCTLGKGNITIREKGLAKVKFSDNNSSYITISLKTEIKDLIEKNVTELFLFE